MTIIIKQVVVTTLSFACLCFSFSAQADFRKALDAYVARDGDVMLKEIKHAIDNQNNEGLILFLSCLELDAVVVNNKAYLYENEKVLRDKLQAYWKKWRGLPKDPHLKNIMGKKLDAFYQLLGGYVQEHGSLEAQYRFKSMRNTEKYYNLTSYNKEKTLSFYQSLVDLAQKGYMHLPLFLAKLNKTELRRFNELYSAKQQSALKKKIAQWHNLAADLGHTKGLLLRAAAQITESVRAHNHQLELQGLQALRLALSKPDAKYYYADVADDISAYYVSKHNKRAYKQAYLWSLVGYTSGARSTSLRKLKKDNILKIIAPALDRQWDEGSVYFELPFLSRLNSFALPDLIAKSKKINLKNQPVISFHRFGGYEYFGYAPVRNYLIDIYADGRVNLAVGPRLDRSQKTETIMRISPALVQKIIKQIQNYGFDEQPLISHSQYAGGCGWFDCYEIYRKKGYAGFSDTITYYYLSIYQNNTERTVMLRTLEGDALDNFWQNVDALLESHVHTLQYRCSSLKEREYYKRCIGKPHKTMTKKGVN